MFITRRKIKARRVINNSLLKQRATRLERERDELRNENSRLTDKLSDFHVKHYEAAQAAKKLFDTFNVVRSKC